nr:MAG TPA: HNH endonuclease [Caudoviricetes sp.]
MGKHPAPSAPKPSGAQYDLQKCPQWTLFLFAYPGGAFVAPGLFYTPPPLLDRPPLGNTRRGLPDAGDSTETKGNDRRRTHSMTNPRSANGALRRKNRARLKAMGGECGICHGRFGPIHYDEPSDAAHPLSFVVDEIKPISRWKQFGYPSARAAAEDWNNLQPAHYFCNSQKGNKVAQNREKNPPRIRKTPKISDGKW